jgi:hypothetical protein
MKIATGHRLSEMVAAHDSTFARDLLTRSHAR